jgi:ribosomal protein S18 acetylase RimI-like enzyme
MSLAPPGELLRDLRPEAVLPHVADRERAGLAIVRRLVDDWQSGANRFDRSGEALFGAWVADRLVGVCGLNVDPYAGDDRVGRVRHLYVLTEVRRHRAGRRLVERVIEAARGRFDVLRLRTSNPAAAALYERAGFRRCAAAAESTHRLELDGACP